MVDGAERGAVLAYLGDVGVSEKPFGVGREVEAKEAISPDRIVIEAHDLAQRLELVVFGGVPEPSGANRVNRFGRVPDGHLAARAGNNLNARLVRGRLGNGISRAANVGATDGNDARDIEERMWLQLMHEIADGVPIEWRRGSGIPPEPDLIDRSISG